MPVLLIEDDIDLGNLLTQYLEMNDIEVTHAMTGKKAMDLFSQEAFDLAVIDVMLPDTNGFAVAKEFKQRKPDFPFLFLTAKNQKEDVIYGLKLGANDYITKPFEPEELVLRIQIALRKNKPNEESSYSLGKSMLKPQELKFCTPLSEYKLTQRESDLLAFIMKNKNQLIKREVLLKSIWGTNDYFLGRSMDVFISRLRRMFKDDTLVTIETFRGVGYIFRETAVN